MEEMYHMRDERRECDCGVRTGVMGRHVRRLGVAEAVICVSVTIRCTIHLGGIEVDRRRRVTGGRCRARRGAQPLKRKGEGCEEDATNHGGENVERTV